MRLLSATAAAVILMALSIIAVPDMVNADALTQAILETPSGTGPGQIDPKAEPGYLGIPGGPQVNLILAFFWAIWVGWIFSTVGAFGGIMAGIGHITIYGLGNYADSFRNTSPGLNRTITDSIRVSNQFMGGLSALVSTINYLKLGRLVWPVGLALALGSILGSYLVPTLTAGKVSFRDYIGYFGLFVLLLGCWMLYETTPSGQKRKKKAKQAAQAFEATMKKKRSGQTIDTKELGVKVMSMNLKKIVFTFFGVEFSFNPLLPVMGGFAIASIAAFLGVGGGFILVPFLTSVAGLPMYLAAGTSAMAVLIGMLTSITSYMLQGVMVHWPLIGTQLVGIVAGSMVGPRTSQYIPDKILTRIFIILAFYVGLNYMARGFLGKDIIGLIFG
ncbi:sulfite exporter TauE/SafE family protein [Desulfonatronovibrio hydrogenovorans]|uniref:sulfite exporter TauE/SafE family protein n=1 Tax=Desulfonatronovibrio hydrogenovorans TaxID=53245 RepID=UPI00048F4916|nr:sulfite exporter TauE/SafE family protein [Desulfonatronovibrio hydrogenovorans]